MKKKLILPVKSKWFQMEKAGIKTEDYRLITKYWAKRLCWTYTKGRSCEDEHPPCLSCMNFIPREYDEVELTEGYPKRDDKERRLTKKFKNVWRSWGRPEWGAPEKRCFIIQWEED